MVLQPADGGKEKKDKEKEIRIMFKIGRVIAILILSSWFNPLV